MPAIKVFPQDVDRKLSDVFTRFGYDGTSMELLSQATGLKKASLYHRFPGGKKDMAAHVLKKIEQWFQANVRDVIKTDGTSMEKRLEMALISIRELFDDGSRNCPLRMLSACSESGYFQESIAACFSVLSEAFSEVAIANGLDEGIAREKAMEAMVSIQGSLVLSRAMNDANIFKNSIAKIPSLLGVS